MRILLIGEYSGLHNNLKKGLSFLGHDVTLINNGDSFKDYPTDLSIKARFFKSKFGNIFRQGFYKLFKYDLALIEHGIRFYFHLNQLKNYDVVQLINEWPIQTHRKLELFLLKKIFKQNDNLFVLCTGVDSYQMNYWLSNKNVYSVLTPYLQNPKEYQKLYKEYFDYLKPNQQKLTDLIYNRCNGLIACDFDYINAIKNLEKYKGCIPYPVSDVASTIDIKTKQDTKVNILLGVNSGNQLMKGIPYFKEALSKIKAKYADTIEINIVENLPYSEYRKFYDNCHILLDQIHAYDQGYNALEAMLHGKTVFTGAGDDFLKHYTVDADFICINALPDANYLIEKLSFLIENPEKIIEIGENARKFVLEYHDVKKVAENYIKVYNS